MSSVINRRQLLKYLTGSFLGNQFLTTSFSIAEEISQQRNTGIIYDKIYLKHLNEPGHPESPERLLFINNKLKQEKLDKLIVSNNEAVDRALIESYLKYIHTEQHIELLKKNHSLSHEVLLKVVSDVIYMTEKVINGELDNAFAISRPPGHHAENTGKIEGFCLYNIIAIAARYAQLKHNLKRILIVDWDYHHGNGTESAFYTDPSVLFFSTHDWHAYPGTGDPSKQGDGDGKGYNINVHLPCNTSDKMILDAFESKLIPKVHEFKPELILVSAGFDSRVEDRLGCFDVSDQGFYELTRLVLNLADQYCDGKVVSILEGGYNLQGNASATVAHIKALLEV